MQFIRKKLLSNLYLMYDKSLFWKELNKLKNIEAFITVKDTNDNDKILASFKEKLVDGSINTYRI